MPPSATRIAILAGDLAVLGSVLANLEDSANLQVESTCDALHAALANGNVDVVLLHEGAESRSGFELAREIRGRCPFVGLVACVDDLDLEHAVVALHAGVDDIVASRPSGNRLRAAIDRACRAAASRSATHVSAEAKSLVADAAGIAHDMGNVLTALSSRLDLLTDERLAPEQAQAATRAQADSHRLVDLHSRLRTACWRLAATVAEPWPALAAALDLTASR